MEDYCQGKHVMVSKEKVLGVSLQSYYLVTWSVKRSYFLFYLDLIFYLTLGKKEKQNMI